MKNAAMPALKRAAKSFCALLVFKVGDGDFRFDGVGDEALFVGGVVEAGFVGVGGLFGAGVGDFWVEGDFADPRAFFAFGHFADGAVFVGVDLEAGFGGEPDVGEEMAA